MVGADLRGIEIAVDVNLRSAEKGIIDQTALTELHDIAHTCGHGGVIEGRDLPTLIGVVSN
jgi:hypothetical protein